MAIVQMISPLLALILFALKSLVDYDDFLFHFHGTLDIDIQRSLLLICYPSFLQLSSSFWKFQVMNNIPFLSTET